MFNENDPYVKFKLDFMQRAMPAKSAIVYGDMYMIDGGYTKKCIDFGCSEALLIDTLETVAWQNRRLETPGIDFYKGDFSNPHFMRSFDRSFDIGIAYEVLLHQAPIIHTLHLMLEKVKDKFLIVQPMLKEQTVPNSLVYLPGNSMRELYPMPSQHKEFQVFDVKAVNHSHWLWGTTVSFMKSVLQGEGFDVIFENEIDFGHRLTKHWHVWGCIAQRREKTAEHWSNVRPTPGLHKDLWD